MALNVDVGRYAEQPKQYGNLAVDVGTKTPNAGNIVLGGPQQSPQNAQGPSAYAPPPPQQTVQQPQTYAPPQTPPQATPGYAPPPPQQQSPQMAQQPPGPPPQPAVKVRQPNHVINTAGTAQMMMGQKVSLNQKVPDISKLMIGLEWDVNYAGLHPFDTDVSLFMVDAANKTEEENFIFYNNPVSRCGSITLGGDHYLGVKDCYNEIVQLDMNRVPPHIQKLAITLTIDEADARSQNFGQIPSAYLKVIDATEISF